MSQKKIEENKFGWSVNEGSAGIYIWVYKPEQLYDDLIMDINIPLIKLPKNNLYTLYDQCMPLNRQLINCSLEVSDYELVLKNSRFLL